MMIAMVMSTEDDDYDYDVFFLVTVGLQAHPPEERPRYTKLGDTQLN